MPKITTPQSTIDQLLTRAITDVMPKDLARAKLESGKKLRIYYGIDPTGAELHLGHSVPLRKLKALQDAGHHIIFVIGSFTAMIGDPSGRDTMREPLTEQQVKNNFATYKKQADLILGLDKVEVRFNSEWLGKLKFKDIVKIAGNFTVQQLLERDMFQNRQCKHLPIGMHELLYPLMVGYDSVVLDVDCELGGNDQLFNMLCGRTLQQAYGKRDKFVLTTKILEGTDGRKMSKTYNNCIYLTDTPNNMYGKVMSIKDELIVPYFEACTELPMSEVKLIQNALTAGDNPKQHKARLAREIVALYHSGAAATKSEIEFNKIHKEGKLPEQIPQYALPKDKKTMPIIELLVYLKLALSKGHARRLVAQSGVKIDGKVVKNWQEEISLKSNLVAQVGSRKFVKFK